MERKEEIWLMMIYNLVIMVPRLMLICRIRAQGNLDIYLAKHIVYLMILKEWVKHLFIFFIVNLVIRV